MAQSDIQSVIWSLDCGKDIETIREHLVMHKEQALPVMLECLPSLRTWRAREAVVCTAIEFARRFKDAKCIGFIGLVDKSKRVQQASCALAAFSLDQNFLNNLNELSVSSDAKTAQVGIAAANAIKHKNHHLFMDREGNGLVEWYVLDSNLKPVE